MEADNAPQKLRELAEKRLLWHYLEIDERGFFVNPPSNDEELYEFIRLAFGVTIPRKVLTEGHRTAFDFIADLFFERTKNALAFANRGGAKTYSVGLLNFLDMFFKPGCEIASAGAIIAQADRCYEYLLEFFRFPWFKEWCAKYQAKMGVNFVTKTTIGETVLANGSKLEIIAGTDKGLRGPHPHKARVDEIDIMDWKVFQTGLSMAKSGTAKDGKPIRGQNVFSSTRQQAAGTMQRLLDEAKDKGITVYEWNVWEIVKTCTRLCKGDPEFGDCPIVEFCRGRAHECDGFFPIEDFIDKARLIDKEEFEVEWLNLKPARHKLVYPMFEAGRHTVTREELRQISGYDYPQASWPRVCGLDFGSSPGHPFAFTKFAQIPTTGQWVLFWEYRVEQDLLRNHAKYIKESPLWHRGELIYGDHDAQDRYELQMEHGILVRPANKDVDMGIDYMRTLFSGTPPEFKPGLLVLSDCEGFIEEMGLYQRKMLSDGRPHPSGCVEKRYDDLADSARYALYSSKGVGQRKYRFIKAKGL